jgi:hypothetical protein
VSAGRLRVVGALAIWTAFVIGVLLLFPWSSLSVGCARLVGTPESRAACQPILDYANQQVFLFQRLPFAVMVATGYVAIVVLEARRRRDGARD